MTFNTPKNVGLSRVPFDIKKSAAASASVLALALMAQPVVAQDTSDTDTIVVTGQRQIIQDAIALKRDSAQIVDGYLLTKLAIFLLYLSVRRSKQSLVSRPIARTAVRLRFLFAVWDRSCPPQLSMAARPQTAQVIAQ